MATMTSPVDARVEMFQRGHKQESFFDMKALAPRPVSYATEFDTDFEDEDGSDFEEDYMPSLEGAGRRSQTTLSSYEEDLPTPKSNDMQDFQFDVAVKPVEGPKGPHLFRYSSESSHDEDYYLTMSPMTPKYPKRSEPTSRPETAFKVPVPPTPVSASKIHRPISSLTEAVLRLDTREIAEWTPRQVARWMLNAGFEPCIAEKFEENDISGAVLITLKFEDLKELDIQSFGKRTKLWHQIHSLRDDNHPTATSPTEIDCGDSGEEEPRRKHKGSRRRKKTNFDDIISPLESISIVGIEQLMPKPHRCAKGQSCSTWKKQQRLIEQFKRGHPLSPNLGGRFLIAGDPGNPATAATLRPFSDAQPSVVASSDALGGAIPPFQHLEEASLANLQANLQNRDPQDNVKQFLDFQHVHAWSSEQPATPPYEMFPPLPQQPHQNLRSLPKLAIPSVKPVPGPRSASAQPFSPGPMDRVEALSPELRNGPAPFSRTSPPIAYRFGTPASDMDVPLTHVNLGPIARDASQSVPPNMSYRHGPGHGLGPRATPDFTPVAQLARSASKASRRPSYAPDLPRLDENPLTAVATHAPSKSCSSSFSHSFATTATANTRHASPSPPPHHKAIVASADGTSHAGWMRKRKTRLLRHEWHEHHFTLRGTMLTMHRSGDTSAPPLETLDIDDFTINCAGPLATSKLSAAFKKVGIELGRPHNAAVPDAGAFSFQLIPEAIAHGRRIRRRESLVAGGGKARGKDETHHFAVRSTNERIDWMRELMLAKALRGREAKNIVGHNDQHNMI